MSTLFKLNEIYDILLNNVKRNEIYTGGNCLQLLSYRNEIMGLTDETFNLYGIQHFSFFQGTCIIFSIDVVKYMLKHQEKFIYEVIDDVSIALFMRSFMQHVYLKGTTYRLNGIIINNNTYNPGPIIRNKHDDLREKDIVNMKKFVNIYLQS